MSDNRISDRVEIHLKYEGIAVDRGTMALHDVIPVLQGFADAYVVMAASEDPGSRHHMEIVDVEQGSADIVLEVWRSLTEDTPPIQSAAAVTAIASTAFVIVRKIFDVARLKTHAGNKPTTETVSGNNNIVVINADGAQMEVSFNSYEIHKEGTLDKPLELLTRPLEPGRIEAAEFEARTPDGQTASHRITTTERPYFELEKLAVTSTRELTVLAILNSLTKSTNSGHLYLNGDRRVFYRYVGDDYLKLHTIFGSYEGTVEIRCTAHLDDKLEVVALDVHAIDRVQTGLFDGDGEVAGDGPME